MKTIGAQFNKISGPDATASYKVEFTVDESQRKSIQSLLDYKKGTSVLLMIFDIENEKTDLNEIANETPDEMLKRLNKQMHALIGDIAENSKIDKSVVKSKLKEYLIKRGLIQESTSELDTNGFAIAIYYLRNEF
jgi:hypothetical protein